MKAEIKLSIQPGFPHTVRLMVIIRIHWQSDAYPEIINCSLCFIKVSSNFSKSPGTDSFPIIHELK